MKTHVRRVEKQPESARTLDWIRFFMLTSSDNSTTVIAVRGTLESWQRWRAASQHDTNSTAHTAKLNIAHNS